LSGLIGLGKPHREIELNPGRRKPSRIDRLLHGETALWAAWLFPGLVWARLRSFCFAHLLRARGLRLGPGCIIRGARFLDFGANIYAHGHLWLEAVAIFRDQGFSPRIVIGDNVTFSEGVHISGIDEIVIGRHVVFGSHVYISDHNHGLYNGPIQSHPDEPPAHRQLGGGGPVHIGDNVWIGDNVVIVGPVSIGCGSIIGANSVVQQDVPPRTIAVGVPARPIKRFEEQRSRWEKL
jgi:acetyltransferase-like isoleucine patch superfamily enzyme